MVDGIPPRARQCSGDCGSSILLEGDQGRCLSQRLVCRDSQEKEEAFRLNILNVGIR